VRFVDERFEGRQEWVPPARLKVPWAAVGVFRQREARWDRIDKLGIGDEPVSRAAEEVFEALIEHDIARIEYREAGVAMSFVGQPFADQAHNVTLGGRQRAPDACGDIGKWLTKPT
jgi:hypothetical protein